jgi:hypothetical protein
MSSSDVKTIRLATLQLTTSNLQSFIVYQQTLLEELLRKTEDSAEVALARAHAVAQKAASLDSVELQKLKAQVGAFCVGARVEQRLMKVSSPKAYDWAPFVERYGEQALALLRAQQDRLVSLDNELSMR